MAQENHFDRATESKPAPFTKTVKGAAPDAPEERLSRRVGGGCRLKPGAYISGVILIQCCG